MSVCVRLCFYFCIQVDSINSLLKGPVMAKACEETKYFYSDHSQPGTCMCVRVRVRVEVECLTVGGVIIRLLIQLLHNSYTLSLSWFYVHRVPPDRRLDRSLSLHYSQEHPGGPLEPAQLYQNPGGEPAEICGWLVDCGHTHTHTRAHMYM